MVVCTDFQRLVASHDEPDLLGLLMSEQTHVACATFLPLRRAGLEAEELCAPGMVAFAGSDIADRSMHDTANPRTF